MEQLNKLAQAAKRTLPVSTQFDELVRAIGESKSKSEEDAIVSVMTEVAKQKVKEPRRDLRTLKELLVYLMYIEMLGHDVSWAQAAVIQLCSEKNLVVKKMAYLATSLLVEPSSELTIMVVATIQADLRSDNFLTVCTALHAICRSASAELITVFLPQVTALLRHDRDLVKKKALLVLQRFLQLDPGVAPDVERHLIDKIGYKEPSVMVASLCGLRELIQRDPAPYRGLAHYFTNILKQAAEGRLGRAYEYHRAPAPFVQLELLRLLGALGAGDKATSDNVCAVVAEVKRRAEPLGNNIGNALVYECVRTITTIYPNPTLIASALESVARFLGARENNLRYAGIDALGRLVRVDPKHAAEHQYAVVDCLRSPDETLKRKTLELLYKMAGPANIEVVAGEVLGYLRGTSDEVARWEAATALCDLAERLAPDHHWFIATLNEVFEVAGEVVPAAVGDSLMRLLAEGTGEEDEEADSELRRSAVDSYLELLQRPKLPPLLLKVICWVLGEYGTLSEQGVAPVMDALAALPDTQAAAADDGVRAFLVSALGKLAAQSGQALTPDAAALVEAATRAEGLELQQRSLEVAALLARPAALQSAALPHDAAAEDVGVDPALPFLEAYIQQALERGAAPYLGEEVRLAMGLVRGDGASLLPMNPTAAGSALKFQAYARTAAPKPPSAAAAFLPAAAAATGPSAAGDLDFGGLSISKPYAAPAPSAAASAAAPSPPAAPAGPQLIVNKPGRKWGGDLARPPAASAPGGAPSSSYGGGGAAASPAASAGGRASSAAAAAAPAVDPERQRLAASLFGGAGGSSSPSPGMRRRGAPFPPKQQLSPQKPSSAPDLLGDFPMEQAGPHTAAASTSAASNGGGALDLLMGLEAGPSATAGAPPAPLQQQNPLAALAGMGAPPAQPGAGGSVGSFVDLLGGSPGEGVASSSNGTPALSPASGFGGLDLQGGSLGGAPPQQPAHAAAAANLANGLQGGRQQLPLASKDPFSDLFI